MDIVIEKAKKIKLLILDIDGVLTDGRIYFNNQAELSIAFHIHDGLGIGLVQHAGIEVALISGRESEAAYVGDDWIDIAPLQMAGLKLTVPNAVTEVKALADWCPPRAGGEGGVRDICDFILKAQGKFDPLLKEFSVKKL